MIVCEVVGYDYVSTCEQVIVVIVCLQFVVLFLTNFLEYIFQQSKVRVYNDSVCGSVFFVV